MPKPPRRQFAEGLLPLQHNYLHRVAGYIGNIRRLRELVELDYLPMQDLQQTLRLTHNLTGSGTTFGFPEISRTARELHAALQSLLMNASSDTARQDQLTLLAKLQPFEIACTEAVNSQTLGHRPEEKKLEIRPVKDGTNDKAVCVVAPASQDIAELAAVLESHGIAVDRIETISKFRSETKIALIFSSDPAKDLVKGGLPAGCACIVISPVDTFAARLAAVRARAQGYFLPGTDPAKIIDRIESLAAWSRAPKTKFDLLLIDGDETVSAFYEQSLQQAGFNVMLAAKPDKAIELIEGQAFDLIIIGAELAECTSFELAAIIRQLSSFRPAPLLFIMREVELGLIPPEADRAKDEFFLARPFNPARLVSVVEDCLRPRP